MSRRTNKSAFAIGIYSRWDKMISVKIIVAWCILKISISLTHLFTKIRINVFVIFNPTGNVDAAQRVEAFKPFVSLTSGSIEKLSLKYQFAVHGRISILIRSVEITSFENILITFIIISAGIMLIPHFLSAWRQSYTYGQVTLAVQMKFRP